MGAHLTATIPRCPAVAVHRSGSVSFESAAKTCNSGRQFEKWWMELVSEGVSVDPQGDGHR